MDEDFAPFRFFIDDQPQLVIDILDQLIPRQGDVQGAGELGVASFLDLVVGKAPDLRALFMRGLTAVELTAHRQFMKGFTDLADEEKISVLKSVEAAEPEFFEALVCQTYNGYYTHQKVMSRLGRDLRPPQPQGYPLERGDLSGLEKVRRRGPIYRQL